MDDVEPGVIPPSSVPRIPQSATRPSREEMTKNPFFAIQATPTRKPASSMGRGGNGFLNVPTNDGNYQSLSPLQLSRSSKHLFNSDPETAGPPSSWSSQGVLETPAKQKSDATLVHSHPVLSTPISGKENVRVKELTSCGLGNTEGKAEEDSIYKTLGWDADDIDDLA